MACDWCSYMIPIGALRLSKLCLRSKTCFVCCLINRKGGCSSALFLCDKERWWYLLPAIENWISMEPSKECWPKANSYYTRKSW
ncbi:hypothetical protein C5167_032432 [Papaver somniferum]|uniref:Uncharacterized protein n=1 Tax=Papaver somniferum TaxID=3469 RepID=A0A4Y7K7B4_PAPSO|nr:hypothetical protein C5167_032432 [Papaver somniferum]